MHYLYRLFLILLSLSALSCSPFKVRSSIADIKIQKNHKTVTHPIIRPLAEGVTTSDSQVKLGLDKFLISHVHSGQINSLFVNASGKVAYSAGQDGKVVKSELVDTSLSGVKTNSFVQSQTIITSENPFLALALSPSERFLAVSQYSYVALVDLKDGSIANELSRVKGRIVSIGWDPRGESVLLGLASGDVYLWNLVRGKDAGKNSTEALELYQSASSPIVGLIYHPSGRAFLSAERDGGVYLWRLLRTERQLGLRDDKAVSDEEKVGKTSLLVGKIAAEITDIWLQEITGEIFVSSSDGQVYRWKLRGLKPLPPLRISQNTVFSAQGVTASEMEKKTIIATTDKSQKLRLSCKSEEDTPQAAIFTKQESKQEQEELPLKKESKISYLIAESDPLKNALTTIRAGNTQTILWINEKRGNLLMFDARKIFNEPPLRTRLENCIDNIIEK